MNKLAVLAFSLLMFFSFMMWYLANGSLNDYFKSQVVLQGEYYTAHTTSVNLVDFTSNPAIGMLKEISIEGNNISTDHTSTGNKLLIIDKLTVELSQKIDEQHVSRSPLINTNTDNKSPFPLITIDKININKLVINIEKNSSPTSNIENIIQNIALHLANDYPQDYPELSAQIYAHANPELNADDYDTTHPNAGPIKTQSKKAKKRSKPQQRFNIASIIIKTLEINTFKDGIKSTRLKNNVELSDIANKKSLVGNQLGGEILLSLFSLAL